MEGMDILDCVFSIMGLYILVLIYTIIREGYRLKWDKLARWVAFRACLVAGGIELVILTCITQLDSKDDKILLSVLTIGVGVMCLLYGMTHGSILYGMSDDNLREDLGLGHTDKTK